MLIAKSFRSEGETFVSQLTHSQKRGWDPLCSLHFSSNRSMLFFEGCLCLCCFSRQEVVRVTWLAGALSLLTADQLTQHKARYCFLHDDDGDGERLNFQSRVITLRSNLMQRKCLSSLWIITSPPAFLLFIFFCV